MKVGIVTPVVTRLPRAHARWEREAGIDEVARIVVEAERLGYHHATCSEHVAIPEDVAATRGATYWDPLSTFGYLAAPTSVIRFATFVLVLGYHHPLELVKRYGTLDTISGGRLILGVGVGSLEPEFTLLDAEFADRGCTRRRVTAGDPRLVGPGRPRAPRRALRLRRAWSSTPSRPGRRSRSGSAAARDDPSAAPSSSAMPGHHSASTPTRSATLVARARRTDAWLQRSAPLDIALQPEALDPLGDPDTTSAAVARLRDAGATILNLRFVHHSAEHYCEQLAAMQALLD